VHSELLQRTYRDDADDDRGFQSSPNERTPRELFACFLRQS